MKTGILFDLDGTLLDTLADLADSVNHVLASFGYPQRTVEEVRQFVGNGAARLIAQAVPEGANPAPVLAAFQPYYSAHCQIKPSPMRAFRKRWPPLGSATPSPLFPTSRTRRSKPSAPTFSPAFTPVGKALTVPVSPPRTWFTRPWHPSAPIRASTSATATWTS